MAYNEQKYNEMRAANTNSFQPVNFHTAATVCRPSEEARDLRGRERALTCKNLHVDIYT